MRTPMIGALGVALLSAAPLLAGDAQLAVAIKSGQRAAALEMIAKKAADDPAH